MKRFFFCLVLSFNLYTTPYSKSHEQLFTTASTFVNIKDSFTFLALGDSYTIGQSVEINERFPVQAVHILRDSGFCITDPDYIAATGWTTGDLTHAISRAPNFPAYDIVTLLIGVNDQFQGVDTTEYRLNFTRLLKTSVGLVSNDATHVFVLSIPDYGETPFGKQYNLTTIAREIKWFNNINRAITTQQHSHYVDITAGTKTPYDSSLITYDGLHPSGKEYKKWAQRLAALMIPVLKH